MGVSLAIEAAAVRIVGKLGVLGSNNRVKEMVITIQKWQQLISAQKPHNLQTILRVISLDVAVDLCGSERVPMRLLSGDTTIVARWWEMIVVKPRRPSLSDLEVRYVFEIMKRSLCGGKIFMTEQSLLGIGPKTLREGDLTVIAKGSRVPLAVRSFEMNAGRGMNPVTNSPSLAGTIYTAWWMEKVWHRRQNGRVLVSVRPGPLAARYTIIDILVSD